MKKTLRSLSPESLAGRRVLVRVDFNVPLNDAGEVTDPIRIERALPTLSFLTEHGARVVVFSHFGRPKGQPVPEMTLRPVSDYLRDRLAGPVAYEPSLDAEQVRSRVNDLEDGDLLLLENTRFDPREKANDPGLASEWAGLGDLYVNDAFGAAHRAHASTDGLPRKVRGNGGEAVAGFLLEKELEFLGRALNDPDRPFVAILGGAKISGKIDVIEALLPVVDSLLIGGAMANTFFGAMGLEVGRSLIEPDRYETARSLMERAGDRIVLPVDCVVAEAISPDAEARVVERSDIAANDLIADVGPATVQAYRDLLSNASTVVWNGPMGVFEMAPFSGGTFGVAQAAAERAQAGATVVLGGGDSAAAAEAAGLADQMTHISTGGGASLEFMAGKTLPGVEALTDN